jgi:hypothetical protein
VVGIATGAPFVVVGACAGAGPDGGECPQVEGVAQVPVAGVAGQDHGARAGGFGSSCIPPSPGPRAASQPAHSVGRCREGRVSKELQERLLRAAHAKTRIAEITRGRTVDGGTIICFKAGSLGTAR